VSLRQPPAGPVLGLVLAAGASTRMGRPKQLAELDGRPLLAHVLRALDAAPVDAVAVALGAHAAEVAARVDLGAARPVVVAGWRRGMGHVLAAAVAAAADGFGAVVVLLGDQPLVSGAAVGRLVAAWRAGAGPVVTAAYGGRPGHPKLFDASLLPALRRLDGDRGARGLLAARPGAVRVVEVGDVSSDADVDDEAGLARVARRLARASAAATVPHPEPPRRRP
jgi:CTP:molybdopterin cytidylyltransferase MocA